MSTKFQVSRLFTYVGKSRIKLFNFIEGDDIVDQTKGQAQFLYHNDKIIIIDISHINVTLDIMWISFLTSRGHVGMIQLGIDDSHRISCLFIHET